MRKILTTTIFLFLVVVGVARAEDFESYTVGNLNGQGEFTSVGANISTNDYYSPVKSVEFVNTGDVYHDLNAVNQVYLEFMLLPGSSRFTVNLNNGVTQTVILDINVVGTGDVSFNWGDGDPQNLGNYATSSWHSFIIVGDIDDNLWRVYVDDFPSEVRPSATNHLITTFHFYNFTSSTYHPFMDDLYAQDEYEFTGYTVSQEKIEWFVPYNGALLNNDEFSDYQIYTFLTESDSHEYLKIKINSQDSNGQIWTAQDFMVSTSSGTLLNPIERGHDFTDGVVTSWGELIGTDLENCSDVNSLDCIWYSIGTLPMIKWIASGTGYTIFDLQTDTGFIYAENLADVDTFNWIFGTSSPYDVACSASDWASSDWWDVIVCKIKYAFYSTLYVASNRLVDAIDIAGKAIKATFPFNIPAQMVKCWDDSAEQELPDQLAFLNLRDENGNIALALDESLFGTSSFVLYSQEMFTTSESEQSWYANIIYLSTFLTWAAFLISLWVTGLEVLALFA